MPIHSLHIVFGDMRTWTLCGQAPFLALILLLYFAGRRRGWPWRSTLLATAALAGGLSLGAAILPSVLGAVAGGIAMWLLAQRLLGLPRAPFAALALGLVALIAVGRWGCFLNDCCFGRASDLPWAVHYGAGSATWLLHQALGWIAPDATAALPVHPYPLYESAGLLLWLPVAVWLGRRLRSEAALLLFTAAYDLALRGCIDGTRAMINIWWALLESPWGLNPFQWALWLAALACALAGIRWERQARTRPGPEPAAARELAPELSWAVFAGLWAIGWISDAGQTPFLHRVLVAALAVAALALRLPAWLPAPRWIRLWAAPVLAAALVLPLGLHIERAAQAGDRALADVAHAHGWLYEVDRKRGVIVRVGTEQESPGSLAQRRAVLDLPEEPTAVSPSTTEPARTGRTWVGGGLLGGGANYRVQDSCSNDYTLYDRRAGGGFVQAEREMPATPSSVWWFGGRGIAILESQTKTVHTGDPVSDAVYRYALQAYDGQGWAEWEHPNLTVGVGAMLGAQNRRTEGSGSALGFVARPSLHFRGGFSFLAVDGGIYDRQSLAGPVAGHVGLSGAIGRGFTRIHHPDDTVVRYFFGALVFPGADTSVSHLMVGVGLEIFASRRLVLGVQGGAVEGGFGMGYVRAVVGP